MIVERYKNYFIGMADVVALGTAEVVAGLFVGIGVGKTNGNSSILFKTSQSMLLYEIKPAMAKRIKRTLIIMFPIGSFWFIIILI